MHQPADDDLRSNDVAARQRGGPTGEAWLHPSQRRLSSGPPVTGPDELAELAELAVTIAVEASGVADAGAVRRQGLAMLSELAGLDD